MTGTVITDLRRRGAVDPSRVLTGPLRAVGLRWLDPGRTTEVIAEGVEHALYVTAGSGTATGPDDAAEEAPDAGFPLVEGTALTLPLGGRTVLTAGTAGLEFFQAVLAVAGRPTGSEAPGPSGGRRRADGHAGARPAGDGPGTARPDRPPRPRRSADPEHPEQPQNPEHSEHPEQPQNPEHPEHPEHPKGGESR
ncbi:hypothetical protein ACFVXQ_29270 [Kitasatospora sp. NPDC058263]